MFFCQCKECHSIFAFVLFLPSGDAVKAPSCACGVIGLGFEVTAKFILFAEFLALRVSM